MSGPPTDPLSHGMTAREREIMDAIDAGASIDRVAADLGLSPRYVRLVTDRCSGSWANSHDFESMVRTGTIALARACAASGGRFA